MSLCKGFVPKADTTHRFSLTRTPLPRLVRHNSSDWWILQQLAGMHDGEARDSSALEN